MLTKPASSEAQNRKIFRSPTQGATCPRVFMQKYAVDWPEGRAASQYSVFIGQKMSLTGQSNGGQHAQCDMREDTNFKASDASGTSVCLPILCARCEEPGT